MSANLGKVDEDRTYMPNFVRASQLFCSIFDETVFTIVFEDSQNES